MVRIITLHKSLGRGYANGSAISMRPEITVVRIQPANIAHNRVSNQNTRQAYKRLYSNKICSVAPARLAQFNQTGLKQGTDRYLSKEALIVQMDEETKALLRNIVHHLKWVIVLLVTILGLLITRSLD